MELSPTLLFPFLTVFFVSIMNDSPAVSVGCDEGMLIGITSLYCGTYLFVMTLEGVCTASRFVFVFV